jgi:hypothetical protein
MYVTPKKLTIGTAFYDDYDGLYFTLQSIRLYHPGVLQRLEFLIIDNNPEGICKGAVKKLLSWINQPVHYIPFTDYKGTSVRNKVFEYAKTDYVMCLDCHVMLAPGSIRKLLEFYDNNQDDNNLLQGPLLDDNCTSIATHFNTEWKSQMWGTWGRDDRGKNIDNPPFEIPAMGLGLFTCRKNAWLGFNPLFRGFGGEENYIHEKYRQAGKKTLCLPFLRWMHRFDRPRGIPHEVKHQDKIRNYIIGFTELGLDVAPIKEHFLQVNACDENTYNEIYHRTLKEIAEAVA